MPSLGSMLREAHLEGYLRPALTLIRCPRLRRLTALAPDRSQASPERRECRFSWHLSGSQWRLRGLCRVSGMLAEIRPASASH